MSTFPILSASIWVPIIGGAMLMGITRQASPQVARLGALLVSLVGLTISLVLYAQFDNQTAEMQFVELVPWMERFSVYYHLGIDGISLPFIVLTSFITVIVVIASWQSVSDQVPFYLAAFLVLQGFMIGLFCALDSILFYVFWEAMLIPMFLIIGIWGGPNRVYATIKFFLYTFLGSVLLLVSIIYLYSKAGSFQIADFYALDLGLGTQKLLFLAFLAAFAVKIPMWPVHTWLPDAHVEAPTGGSVVLAAIMLKMGAYGMLRYNLPIVPEASQALSGFVIALSLIAIVYIGAVAIVQQDMKKLIAYSSISHMGFVTLGIFLFSARGIEGALVQMVSHGFISAAMFLCVGVLYDRVHSRQIGDYGGVVNTMPVFASFWLLFAMANSGLPGTSGFVGEFLVILAAFEVNFWFALVAASSLILAAAYNLWMYKRVVFGKAGNAMVEGLSDVNKTEVLVLVLLTVCVLGLGVFPNPLLDVMHPSVENLISLVNRGGG